MNIAVIVMDLSFLLAQSLSCGYDGHIDLASINLHPQNWNQIACDESGYMRNTVLGFEVNVPTQRLVAVLDMLSLVSSEIQRLVSAARACLVPINYLDRSASD